jgi:hypothetical protein
LTTTPARYGVPWDLSLESDQEDVRALAGDLAEDADVAAVALEYEAYVRIDDREVGAFAYEPVHGALPSTVLDGREPSRPGEVLVGPVLLDRLGLQIGDSVTLRSAASEDDTMLTPFRIVGTALTPTTQNDPYFAAIQLAAEDLLPCTRTRPRSWWL